MNRQRVLASLLHMYCSSIVHGIKAKEFLRIQCYLVIIYLFKNMYIILNSYLYILCCLGFPCVKLQTRLSQFWRHQKGTPRWYLSTIESIHQILIEYTEAEELENKSFKNYDNMLFFFRFMYEKIHQLYEHDKLKSYRRPVNI